MEPQLVFYLLAIVALLFGALVNHPRFDVTRCIALALALVLLAQVVGGK